MEQLPASEAQYRGVRAALADVPELLAEKAYLHRLLRLGGLNPEPSLIKRIMLTLYWIGWISGLVGIVFLVGLALDTFLSGSSASSTTPALGSILVTGSLWAATSTTGLVFQIALLVWMVRITRWRKQIAFRSIGMHLALTPAGGWIIAAAARERWRAMMIAFAIPTVACGLLTCLSFVAIAMSDVSQLIPAPPGGAQNAASLALAGQQTYMFWLVMGLVGVALITMLADSLTFGLAALCFVGAPRRVGYSIVGLIILPGFLFSIRPTILMGASQDYGLLGFGLFVISVKVLCLGIGIWLCQRHLRRAGPDWAEKVLRQKGALNAGE